MIATVHEARHQLGDVVQVYLPRAHSKRGVWGITPIFTTSPEAKFDGAVGRVTSVQAEGQYEIPLYLVDFREFDNSRIGIPWQAQWFREEWLIESTVAPATSQSEPQVRMSTTRESDGNRESAANLKVADVNLQDVLICPEDRPIKANIQSGIYHTPASRAYLATIAEHCFATVEEAEAAGYRAPKR